MLGGGGGEATSAMPSVSQLATIPSVFISGTAAHLGASVSASLAAAINQS